MDDLGTGTDQAWGRWLAVWTLLCLPGLALAMLLWGVNATMAAVVFPAVMGAAAQAVALSATRRTMSRRELVRACAWAGVACGIIGVVLGAVSVISVGAAFGLLLFMGLSSPPGRTLMSRRPPAALGAQPPGRMSDLDLCRAWSRSYLVLQESQTLEEAAVLVQLRQSYLDELESRNAPALQAWLSSGALAAGSPEWFLPPGGGRPDAA